MQKLDFPFNQLYRKKLTFDKFPQLETLFNDYSKHSVRNNFIRVNDSEPSEIIIKGRRYDCALSLGLIDFNGKNVCEVGARDSIFGSYLTKYADKVYVSDYFEGWGKGTAHDLGGLGFWEFVWKQAAVNPEKIICEKADILHMNYTDNMFDVVIATHVLNYTVGQTPDMDGDSLAIKELARICKKGGYIIVSVIVGPDDGISQGSHVYTSDTIFERIINKSGCKLLGSHNFDLTSIYNDGLYILGSVSPVSDCFFILEKI